MTMSTGAETTDSPHTPETRPPIDLGLLVCGKLDPIDHDAIRAAHQRLIADLERWFPEFRWRVGIVRRQEMNTDMHEEPVRFFNEAQIERDLQKWDFVFVVTSADLMGHDKPYTLAVVSRTLDLAVLSTLRVDPHTTDAAARREDRVELVAGRLAVLMHRCLGHLNGLEERQARRNLMSEFDDISDLDHLTEFDDDQRRTMRDNLRSIADLRLEERNKSTRARGGMFLLRAAWMQRREILARVLQARPWQLPLRLSRLTTAAVSAMIVLLLTAETWELSMNQSLASVGALMLGTLTVTTGYVVTRQRLIARRYDRLITEQIAVSNVASTLTVLSGLVTMLIVLFGGSLAVGWLLFPQRLVENWAASVEPPFVVGHYLLLSGVVASVSVAIGALGATFESQSYFRHVILVDDEL